MAVMLTLAFAACGEKENNDNNVNNPATNPGTNPGTENLIKAGKFTTGKIIINDEIRENVFGIDFDNDGYLEFGIYGDAPYIYIAYDYASHNNIVNKAEQWDYMDILDAGVTIDETCHFDGQGDAAFDNFDNLPGVFYIGLRFTRNDGMHYAWAKVLKENNQLNWEETFYNSKPSAAIKTGQK